MTEAIEKMMQRLDEKLDEFRKELKEGPGVAATAARRALGLEPRHVFKKSPTGEFSWRYCIFDGCRVKVHFRLFRRWLTLQQGKIMSFTVKNFVSTPV